MVRGVEAEDMTIVVVTGSRELRHDPNRLEIKRRFFESIDVWVPDQLFHGGADGPDSWAALEYPEIARMFRPVEAPARTPAQRLFDRNETMINEAVREGKLHDSQVVLVACWDGKSSGTKHAMNFANRRGVYIDEVRID